MTCTTCVYRRTAVGMPSYCLETASPDYGPGKLIPPQHIAAAPAWCPKREDAA